MLKEKIKKVLGGIAFFLILFAVQYGIEHLVYLLRDAVFSGAVKLDAQALSGIGLFANMAVVAVDVIALGYLALRTVNALASGGVKDALITSSVLSFSRLVYLVPHYYMSFISTGYDTVEALLLLLPLSLFIIIVYIFEVLFVSALACLPAFVRYKKTGVSVADQLKDAASEAPRFDVGNAFSAAIALLATGSILKQLVTVIVNTVFTIIDKGSSLGGDVILSIVWDFVFVLLLWILTHTLLFRGGRSIRDLSETPDGDVEDERPDAG
ncbi:MAG: hypothetical protein IKC32_05470 [Clostridia bacterium]|nr:hypothetical protein [Clostridia bacterium]